MRAKMVRWLVASATLVLTSGAPALAKDLGDILLKKGLITEDELKQAREEEKQKTAAQDSLRDSVAAKIPKWLDAISLFGDLRNRTEGFYGNEYHSQTRYRIRGRVGLNANVTDEISATVRLATGDSNDPISTNQTLGNAFTRKPFNLDWAYMTIKPGKTFGLEPGWGQIVFGKFGLTLARESELVWDDDLSPEGLQETVNLWTQRDGFFRSFRVNALQWELNEVNNNNDSYVVGGQAALDTAMGTVGTWSASFGDYSFQGMNRLAATVLSPTSGSASAANCSAAQLDKDPMSTCYATNGNFNSSLANSNSVVLSGKDSAGNQKIKGYLYGFNLINVNSELNFYNPFGVGIPAGVFGDIVTNTQADAHNTGVVFGVGIGNAGKDWYHDSLKNPGDWGVVYCWERVEKDAAVSLFSYSDFVYQQVNDIHNVTQKGSTNVTGSVLRLDYELFPNFQLTAKSHFMNALENHLATGNNGKPITLIGNPTLTRLQIDAVLKF